MFTAKKKRVNCKICGSENTELYDDRSRYYRYKCLDCEKLFKDKEEIFCKCGAKAIGHLRAKGYEENGYEDGEGVRYRCTNTDVDEHGKKVCGKTFTVGRKFEMSEEMKNAVVRSYLNSKKSTLVSVAKIQNISKYMVRKILIEKGVYRKGKK